MITYFIILLLTYLAYKIYIFTRCPKEIEHIPAAPLLHFFKFHLEKRLFFTEKMEKYFQPYFNEHGVIRVFCHVGWSLYISEGKIAKEISIKSDIFEKPSFEGTSVSENFKKFFGQKTVLVANSSEWRKHRKIINPIFNKTWNTEMFGNCAKDLIDEWEKVEGEIVINDKIQRMTLDVFGKAIFDIEFKSVKNAQVKLYNLYNYISDEIFGKQIYLLLSFLEYLPFIRRPKLKEKLDEYHEIIQDLIKSKQQDLKDGKLSKNGDLISALIESNENSQDYKLTMEEIRDNLNVFIIAGHDTTSNTLISTLYYLARYTEIQDKLRAQVLAAMDNPTKVQIPTIEQLREIPLLDKVSKESMRIMTTVQIVQRKANSTYALSNGLVIPKNTYIFLHLWGIHHNPNTFPNPYEFNPNRFDDITSEQSKLWQPFTLGNRTCIGSNFSLMEQRVTIAMLLQKFEFSISNDSPDYQRLRIADTVFAYPKEISLNIKSRI